MFKSQLSAHSVVCFGRAALLGTIACAALSAQSFKGAQMFILQDHKLKLANCTFDLHDSSLVAVTKGKVPETARIPYGGD